MSRVFEALAKAGEEKHGQVQRPVEEVESTVTGGDARRRKRLNPRTRIRSNGTISKTNGALHETHELYPEVTNG